MAKIIEEQAHYKDLLTYTNDALQKRLDELITTRPELQGCLLNYYKWFFAREKMIYSTLNMFKLDNTWFKGICWCPTNMREEVDSTITELRISKKVLCSNLIELPGTSLAPPTRFRTNEFLQPFHDIVQSYGVPSYKEINPSLFTIITFPFLFGVMFGDLAHGLVLMGVALYLCLKKFQLKKKRFLLEPLMGSRYLLLLMGLFSSFCGLIYNEFASTPLVLTESCYSNNTNRTSHCTYPLGIDPEWFSTKLSMEFINSYKMKLSIIIAVFHMTFGVILKGFNDLYSKNLLNFVCEFIPQILFMLLIFGNLVLLIIIKWATDWKGNSLEPPSLLTILINFALKGGDPGPIPLYGNCNFQLLVHQCIICIHAFLIYSCGDIMYSVDAYNKTFSKILQRN